DNMHNRAKIPTGESHAGKLSASRVITIGAKFPTRELPPEQDSALSDDPLQRRRVRSGRQNTLPIVANWHALHERIKMASKAARGQEISYAEVRSGLRPFTPAAVFLAASARGYGNWPATLQPRRAGPSKAWRAESPACRTLA